MLNEGDRAIVIGLGCQGARVVAAARARWAARPPTAQRVAWMDAPTPHDALQAMAAAVSSISRLLPDALLSAGQSRVNSAGVIRVLVVCGLAENAADEALVVARVARRAVEGVADVRMVGLAILPDPDLAFTPARSATRERLRAWLGSGGRPTMPVFDGGCLCLGSANQLGFTLSAAERAALGAEMVVQWLSGPLDESHWPSPAPPSALISAGIAAWVYPVERLQAWLADRIARAVLDAWLEPAPEPGLAAADSSTDLVSQFDLSRQTLGEEAAPSSFFGDLNIPTDSQDLIFGGLWSNPYAALEAEYHTRLEALTERRDLLERSVNRLATRVMDAVARDAALALDEPAPGRLKVVLRRLATLRETLGGLVEEARASAERRFDAVAHLDAEREEMARQMGVLTGHLPANWLAWLSWLIRPWRLWGAYQAGRAMRALSGSIAALLQQCLSLTVDLVRDDQCQAIYRAAAEGVARLEADVLRLTDRLEQARGQVEPVAEELYGVLGFPTECSLLTSEMVAALTQPLEGDTGFMLREAAAHGLRLSDWLNDPPPPPVIVAGCLAYGRQHTVALDRLTADELFRRRFPTEADRWEAVQSMMTAAVPFLRWNETQAGSLDRNQAVVSRWLALAQGESSALFAEASGRIGKIRAIATEDASRITAVQVVQGVALDALILDEEVSDGIEADSDVAVV